METYVFNTCPDDNTPQNSAYHGASGWWTVPQNWYMWQESNLQIWTSPNENREPRYAVKIDYDGTAKFQDPYRSRLAANGQL